MTLIYINPLLGPFWVSLVFSINVANDTSPTFADLGWSERQSKDDPPALPALTANMELVRIRGADQLSRLHLRGPRL